MRTVHTPVSRGDSLAGKRTVHVVVVALMRVVPHSSCTNSSFTSDCVIMPPSRPSPFGNALRHWRTLRRLSQLELASLAGTPPRHVSFLETGRARPTEGMVRRLALALDLPPEDQNGLLSSAGFAPVFLARALSDEALAGVQFVVHRLLDSHEPFPALVVNAWYDVLAVNRGAAALLAALGVPMDGALAEAAAPNLVDLLLTTLHPSIVNHDEVVRTTQLRLRRDLAARPADTRLTDLLERVTQSIASRPKRTVSDDATPDSPVLLTRFRTPHGILDTLSAFVHFGGAHDVTVHGLHVELIYPADTNAAAMLQLLTAM